MQKIYLLVLSFIFLLSVNTSFAKEPVISVNSEQQIIRVDYELPYPGLLPDNPIYFLRIIRDKAVGFLISDPLKKSEFNLLQADKRLNAGIYLFDKRKTSLALSTISKAENYFEEALEKLEEAKMQGKDTGEMDRKLRNALGRHKQEMELFVGKASADFAASFEKVQKRVADFEKRLNR